ncbi:hypothetical protein FNH22_05275 [Fulvivirga sp. M361]|uniref:hypothetical protein n=1 Tax=Fulvivirga sp. M361 TaxID=2594266 RepID=UPI00117AA772|nr:hypothetical protein [Fulvivirga sp. M361]TRX61467.1 hypothetical protein FNH22_05275 [Fulvivirga sp. M361]
MQYFTLLLLMTIGFETAGYAQDSTSLDKSNFYSTVLADKICLAIGDETKHTQIVKIMDKRIKRLSKVQDKFTTSKSNFMQDLETINSEIFDELEMIIGREKFSNFLKYRAQLNGKERSDRSEDSLEDLLLKL